MQSKLMCPRNEGGVPTDLWGMRAVSESLRALMGNAKVGPGHSVDDLEATERREVGSSTSRINDGDGKGEQEVRTSFSCSSSF